MRIPSVINFDRPTNSFGRCVKATSKSGQEKDQIVFYIELTHFSLLEENLQHIQRATRRHPSTKNMRINHRRFQIRMTEQFLHSANIGPIL